MRKNCFGKCLNMVKPDELAKMIWRAFSGKILLVLKS